MSARIRQVKAGTVKVGDTLDGYVVTGLGRVWSLDEEESCAWGAGPWERVRVQYAYGEKAAARPVQAPAVVAQTTPAVDPAPAKPAAPRYGSREWKQDRLDSLPAIICDYEYRALMGRRSARVHEQSMGRDAERSLVALRAEMESLAAELAQ